MTTPTNPTQTDTGAADEPDELSSLEKGLDFTIGAALLTAETLEQVVGTLVEKGKIAREHAPAVFETLMERGRPTREQWLRTLKSEILPQFKLNGPDAGASEGEIETLEERVVTLEQQVSPTPAGETQQGVSPMNADDAIAHEATVVTGDGRESSSAPPTQPAVSEEITTGTAAEPEVSAPPTPATSPTTEQSDAAVTGADTATDIEIGEPGAAADPSRRPDAPHE